MNTRTRTNTRSPIELYRNAKHAARCWPAALPTFRAALEAGHIRTYGTPDNRAWLCALECLDAFEAGDLAREAYWCCKLAAA